MKKIIIQVVAVAAVAALAGPTTASATAEVPGFSYSLTCETLSITAPIGSRVIFGWDSEPPGEALDGETRTIQLDNFHSTHQIGASVLMNDIEITFVHDTIEGCPTTTIDEPPVPVPGIVASTDTARGPTPLPTFQASALFPGLELADPW